LELPIFQESEEVELNEVTSAVSAATTAGFFVLICDFPLKVRSVRLQQFETTVNMVEIEITLKNYLGLKKGNTPEFIPWKFAVISLLTEKFVYL
jgi:hypothetical protein